jgi:hypothetical protein
MHPPSTPLTNSPVNLLTSSPLKPSKKLAPHINLEEHKFSDPKLADDVPLMLLILDILYEQDKPVYTAFIPGFLVDHGISSECFRYLSFLFIFVII